MSSLQLRHEAGLSEDPVSLRGLVSHTDWGCYPTVADVDALISYLNPRGNDPASRHSMRTSTHSAEALVFVANGVMLASLQTGPFPSKC